MSDFLRRNPHKDLDRGPVALTSRGLLQVNPAQQRPKFLRRDLLPVLRGRAGSTGSGGHGDGDSFYGPPNWRGRRNRITAPFTTVSLSRLRAGRRPL